jgi:hypothetical protein
VDLGLDEHYVDQGGKVKGKREKAKVKGFKAKVEGGRSRLKAKG